jgi:hypothetical protein|tara:strand:+ start:135 stop:326 length:192 start_codon:yes stop_codon:yes gene_type:complete
MKIEKKYEKVFNNIEKVRSKNNKNWIDILRLAFKHSPKEAKIIFKAIVKKDKQLIKLAKDLHK